MANKSISPSLGQGSSPARGGSSHSSTPHIQRPNHPHRNSDQSFHNHHNSGGHRQNSWDHRNRGGRHPQYDDGEHHRRQQSGGFQANSQTRQGGKPYISNAVPYSGGEGNDGAAPPFRPYQPRYNNTGSSGGGGPRDNPFRYGSSGNTRPFKPSAPLGGMMTTTGNATGNHRDVSGGVRRGRSRQINQQSRVTSDPNASKLQTSLETDEAIAQRNKPIPAEAAPRASPPLTQAKEAEILIRDDDAELYYQPIEGSTVLALLFEQECGRGAEVFKGKTSIQPAHASAEAADDFIQHCFS